MQCELEKELILYPRHFGPNLKNFLTEKLIAKVDHALPCTASHTCMHRWPLAVR